MQQNLTFFSYILTFLRLCCINLKNSKLQYDLKNITKILLFSTNSIFFKFLLIGKLPGGDARKFPADPKERVKKNLEEGRGFKINGFYEKEQRGGVFDFASSNELWRASLDVIDFMPLVISKL